jgi:hypothetical protein
MGCGTPKPLHRINRSPRQVIAAFAMTRSSFPSLSTAPAEQKQMVAKNQWRIFAQSFASLRCDAAAIAFDPNVTDTHALFRRHKLQSD